ncbi:alpha-galactosidase A [Plectosphaerella plurivora]|uniref:Alpha-galactosidase A n=1 Tax=Plectosphaerella plurivora TaxID=936078 RepID=A0A9P9A9G6_9PEZI|nr:alpha-galactosidase A [Plectosphaerella plurivora]
MGTLSLPKSDMEILNQVIDDERGAYRLRAGQRVYYLFIAVDVFEEDTMCRPYLLIPSLPDLPDSSWTSATIVRGTDGAPLVTTISTDPLPEIKTVWHERRIDVLSLERTKRLRSWTHEVLYQGGTAVAKIACFAWDVRRIERETEAYRKLMQHRRQHPEEPPMAPEFLGHLTENGRVMGFLLQKIDGGPACIDHLPDCEALVRRVHRLGMVHGDLNRYNFVINRARTGCVRLVDFEHFKDFDEDSAMTELASLTAELVEDTGRGEVSRC